MLRCIPIGNHTNKCKYLFIAYHYCTHMCTNAQPVHMLQVNLANFIFLSWKGGITK